MAGSATSRDGRVVHKSDAAPVRGDVAVRTLPGRQYMIDWFSRCTNQTALRVTAGAALIGWAECRADVASLARYIGMCAIQYEPGAEVIKGLLGIGCYLK